MPTKIVNKIKEAYDIYIGRPSIFGNPYIIGEDGTREEVIKKFETYFYKRIDEDLEFKSAVIGLRGKRLGCFCAPDHDCHGRIYVEYLETPVVYES